MCFQHSAVRIPRAHRRGGKPLGVVIAAAPVRSVRCRLTRKNTTRHAGVTQRVSHRLWRTWLGEVSPALKKGLDTKRRRCILSRDVARPVELLQHFVAPRVRGHTWGWLLATSVVLRITGCFWRVEAHKELIHSFSISQWPGAGVWKPQSVASQFCGDLCLKKLSKCLYSGNGL